MSLTRYGVLLLSNTRRGSASTDRVNLETKQAQRHALELSTANQALKAQIVNLQRRNAELLRINANMALKITNMGHYQPAGYVHVHNSSSAQDRPTPSRSTSAPIQNMSSTSHASAQIFHPAEPAYKPQNPKLTPPRKTLPSTATQNPPPAPSAALVDKYASVFDGLSPQSPPALRLTNSRTGEQVAASGSVHDVGSPAKGRKSERQTLDTFPPSLDIGETCRRCRCFRVVLGHLYDDLPETHVSLTNIYVVVRMFPRPGIANLVVNSVQTEILVCALFCA